MTKRHWLILADYFRRGWGVPDHSHGDVDPGPYAIEGEAEKALDSYLLKNENESMRSHFVVVQISLPIREGAE